MNTCEMVLLADENGKTYFSKQMAYNKRKGFYDMEDGTIWPVGAFSDSGLNFFIHMNEWQPFEPEYTMEELFKKVGHKFKIK